jgi:hypothetical protein
MISVYLVVMFSIGGMDYNRRELMPSAEMCFARASEMYEEMLSAHPEIDIISVGCVGDKGDPA